MSTKHVHFTDASQQAALFETMMLAAGADGAVTREEVEVIYRRVFERPEFQGIGADDLKQAIAHAAQQVARKGSMEGILPEIAARLPDRESRMLAFGLAASVAVADHRADPRELRVLKALQDAFELPEEVVVELFERAETNAPLPPTHIR